MVAAADGAAALAAASEPPDLVILDLGLPDMDGTEVIEGLRGWSRAPIIVLSARQAQGDKVVALDVGADDYMTKPFGMDELLARLRAALRRSGGDDQAPVVETASFAVDLAAKQARANGEPVHLTPTEWHLLEVLIRHEGKLVPRKQLLQRCGAPRMRPRRITCASTWRSCARLPRGGSGPPAPPADRAGHGLPLRARPLDRLGPDERRPVEHDRALLVRHGRAQPRPGGLSSRASSTSTSAVISSPGRTSKCRSTWRNTLPTVGQLLGDHRVEQPGGHAALDDDPAEPTVSGGLLVVVKRVAVAELAAR